MKRRIFFFSFWVLDKCKVRCSSWTSKSKMKQKPGNYKLPNAMNWVIQNYEYKLLEEVNNFETKQNHIRMYEWKQEPDELEVNESADPTRLWVEKLFIHWYTWTVRVLAEYDKIKSSHNPHHPVSEKFIDYETSISPQKKSLSQPQAFEKSRQLFSWDSTISVACLPWLIAHNCE